MKPRITKNKNPQDPLGWVLPWTVIFPGGGIEFCRSQAAALSKVRRYYERLGIQQDYAKVGR